MMIENEDAMSFIPGDAEKNLAGRFIVHDRALVEAEILPKYFNHASFASLRRQLNYFHFIREGKGRMKGATYYNEAVFEIEDILKLRRRNEPVGASGASSTKQPSTSGNDKKVKPKPKAQTVVSSDTDEDNRSEVASTSSRRKRKKASSESTKVGDESPANESSSSAHVISPSESMDDIMSKGAENASASTDSDEDSDCEDVSVEGSLASYKSIQTNNQNKKPTIVLDLTRPSESDFTTPFYAHGYASFSQLQQQHHEYCNDASYVQPLHQYQHHINHDAGTFSATASSSGPHPITPHGQGDTTWEDEMEGCSALLALQSCGPPPTKKPRQVSA